MTTQHFQNILNKSNNFNKYRKIIKKKNHKYSMMEKPVNANAKNLASFVNYEDIEFIDYDDNFMDENMNNKYSGKYSFLSDYKSSFKGSFVHNIKPEPKQFLNKFKYSFESTTSVRTSNEIADVFKENIFTKNSIPGLIFEFISANQNLIMLLNSSDMENYFPKLGLKFKPSRKDALELDKDFQKDFNLEILRRVLFGKTAEKSTKEISDEIKTAYKILLLKILLELSCVKYLHESFLNLSKLDSSVETTKILDKNLITSLSLINRDNFEIIYSKDGLFKEKLKEYNSLTSFLKNQIEKGKLFKSFFKQNSEILADDNEKSDVFSVFESMICIYEGFEIELKGHFDVLNSDYGINMEDLKVSLRTICENYLDKEKNWEILLQYSHKKLIEILKLENTIKQFVNLNQKLNKINLVFRKVYHYSIEKPREIQRSIIPLEEQLQTKNQQSYENEFYTNKLYEINKHKTDLIKLFKELKSYRKGKIPNHELSSILYGVIEETETVYKNIMSRILWAQNQLEYAKNLSLQHSGFSTIRCQGKLLGN